jgi:hypothetical protein
LATRRGAFLRRAAGSGQQCRYRGCWRRPPSLSSAQARWGRETDVTVALTLRRTGLSSPAYRDWLDYVIVEDGRDVGRLYEDRHSRPEYRWFWSITVYVNPARGIVTSGRASARTCPPPHSITGQRASTVKAKHAIIFQEGTETSSKKLSVSLFAATQVATHPGISSSDDQDTMGRVRYGSPNAC